MRETRKLTDRAIKPLKPRSRPLPWDRAAIAFQPGHGPYAITPSLARTGFLACLP